PNLGVSAQRGGLCADARAKLRCICTKRRFMCRCSDQTLEYLHKETVYVQMLGPNFGVSARKRMNGTVTEGKRRSNCTKRAERVSWFFNSWLFIQFDFVLLL
ncbi:hypothetical protein, partial [Alkalihalobacillus pseudalcaliphilus]|uniref:hypothetical protein n=1 Tax=Alkalihalobacillus pseudalcaliphilus TaxID=79884 RepID=UPI002362D738